MMNKITGGAARARNFALSLFVSLFIIHHSSFIIPTHAAQDNAGANSGISLRFSPSVRAAAMGDAFAAEARGVAAAYYNPAGLAWTDQRELLFSYQRVVLDVGQGSIGYAHPLGASGAWALLGQYVDYGSTRRTIVSGTAGAYSGTFSGQDVSMGASYGARLGNWGYGLTAKIFSSQIDNSSASAFAADLGVRWQSENSPFAFGATVANLGTKLKYDSASENLPILFRAGASWEPIRRKLLLTADLEKVSNENWSGHAGAEYRIAEIFAIRAGYDGSIDVGSGLTVGAGFRSGGFDLDYAYIPFGNVGDNHRVGIGYRF